MSDRIKGQLLTVNVFPASQVQKVVYHSVFKCSDMTAVKPGHRFEHAATKRFLRLCYVGKSSNELKVADCFFCPLPSSTMLLCKHQRQLESLVSASRGCRKGRYRG